MCERSFGMPYCSQRYAVSAAEERYIASVNHAGSSTNPSCSIPSDEALALRAWYAVSASLTIWVTSPSEDRIT